MEVSSLKRITNISQTTKKVKSNKIITNNKPHQGGEGTSEGNLVPMILSLFPVRILGTRLASHFPRNSRKASGKKWFLGFTAKLPEF